MRILITAGPTREYLDSVRYLSNASTGKMGFALATVAASRGHRVALVTGPVDLSDPPGVIVARVVSAAEMLAICSEKFADCDAAIMAAAVCDYRPVERKAQKLPKSTEPWPLLLEPTPDICATLGAAKQQRVLVGFALEDHGHRVHAEEKLRRKNCDAIVLNRPEVIGQEQAEIELFGARGWTGPFAGPKSQLAEQIVMLVEQLAGAGTA